MNNLALLQIGSAEISSKPAEKVVKGKKFSKDFGNILEKSLEFGKNELIPKTEINFEELEFTDIEEILAFFQDNFPLLKNVLEKIGENISLEDFPVEIQEYPFFQQLFAQIFQLDFDTSEINQEFNNSLKNPEENQMIENKKVAKNILQIITEFIALEKSPEKVSQELEKIETLLKENPEKFSSLIERIQNEISKPQKNSIKSEEKSSIFEEIKQVKTDGFIQEKELAEQPTNIKRRNIETLLGKTEELVSTNIELLKKLENHSVNQINSHLTKVKSQENSEVTDEVLLETNTPEIKADFEDTFDKNLSNQEKNKENPKTFFFDPTVKVETKSNFAFAAQNPIGLVGSEEISEVEILHYTNGTQLVKELGALITKSVKGVNGVERISVELNPKELGKIQLEVNFQNQQLETEIVVTNDKIKNMVEANLGILHDLIDQKGLSLEKIEVKSSTDESSKYKQQQQENHDEHKQQNFNQKEQKQKQKQFGYNTFEYTA